MQAQSGCAGSILQVVISAVARVRIEQRIARLHGFAQIAEYALYQLLGAAFIHHEVGLHISAGSEVVHRLSIAHTLLQVAIAIHSCVVLVYAYVK